MKLFRCIVDNIEEYLCAFLIGCMLISLIVQVSVRVVTHDGMAWTEEFSRFCFIWAVFVGMVLAAKRCFHVRISAQFLLFPLSVRLFFRILADGIWVLFNCFIVYQSSIMIMEGLEYPEISPALQWVKTYVELIIPICFLVSSLRIIQGYYGHWKNGTLYDMVRSIDTGENI